MRSKLAAFALLGSLFAPAAARADVDDLATLPGFKIDLVLKADKEKHGSWISLGKDGKGRLLLGGQRNQPLTRLTLDDTGKVTKEEVLKLPVSEIMGVLWAFDSLYVNGSDGKKFCLFRLKDKEDDGNFESVEMLREWQGGAGEHGAHGIVLGKDDHLYVVAGNFVNVPTDVEPTSPHRNYADDTVLPRSEDGNGFGAGRKPPGGYVVRLDKDGKDAQLYASGQRNCYDIAMSPDGEIFGYDSDMEWDWGTPWYRPTRVFHAVSGADHGFREGTAKWPEYYPDSLPATLNIGIGCPTGVEFGTGAKFPAKYQKALYILDWTYGRVMAVHLTSAGAGYTGSFENFVAPKGLIEKSGKKTPNNVTDIVVGTDGAIYFTTGGRNTQGNLYRVSYTGKEATAAVAADTAGAEARAARKGLEQFHTKAEPKAIDAAWAHLGSADRYLRYAARIAIERQPLGDWKEKALGETNPQASLTALLAVARLGGRGDQPAIFANLAKLSAASLSDAQKLERIRVLQVSVARQGKPAPAVAAPLVAELSASYPAAKWEMNRELSQTLIALEAPDAVAKTIQLLGEAKTQEEQVAYTLALKAANVGWTPALRKQYLSWWTIDRSKLGHPDYVMRWFDEAGRAYGDGSSFARFLGNLHKEVTSALPPEQAKEFAEVIAAYTPPGAKQPKNQPKPRTLVKQYEMKDLESSIASASKGRNFNRGKQAFIDAQCLACHKFGNEGGAAGPDITAVSSRFQRRDILESIVLPSKVISEQYQNMDVRLKDGDVVWGRIVEDTADKLVVVPDPLKPDTKVTVKKSDVKSVGPSKLSPMPEGLINVLTKDEILDMLAYVESGGNKAHPAFSK
ncbi:c-type cytochrome [Humisphaera borealis]|uniref:C-type cytochrome n=1 Tax=Humisphaera borealis TaxID=2807512 RepID=A0A7M2WX84_9BACT|nr:c-type cytochrome [Humisphaera borealis]QOV90105.1 c-type cytochrome [Humisphaera borealis]